MDRFFLLPMGADAPSLLPYGAHDPMLAGSLALGCGVWGMHFIGMLAYQLCTTVTYDTDLTTASVLPSVGASWVALRLLASDRVNNRELVIAGVLVGAGIGTPAMT